MQNRFKIYNVMYPLTFLMLIGIICLTCIQFNAEIHVFGKTFIDKINLVKWLSITHRALRTWRIWVLLFSLVAASILIDKFFIQWIIYLCSKDYQIEKYTINQKYQELYKKVKHVREK